MTRISLSFFLLLTSLFLKAQDANVFDPKQLEPQMADQFRADGKIYVVITVISMIFAAIIVFLVVLERKIKKMENKMKEL